MASTIESFRVVLTKIVSKLEKENLERLKFLCKDVIPDGDRENISSPEQLLIELEHRRKLAPNNLKFLQESLELVGRHDLAHDLKVFEHSRPSEKGNKLDLYQQRRYRRYLGIPEIRVHSSNPNPK